MKITQLVQRNYVLLEVSEALNAQNVAELRQGLEKIYKSSKSVVILDLLLAKAAPEAVALIEDLHLQAFKTSNDLFIVDKDPSLAQFSTRKEAVQLTCPDKTGPG